MNRVPGNIASRYGAAVVCVAVAMVAGPALDPSPGGRSPFAAAIPAVLVAAAYGGLGPGLLATALGAVVPVRSYPTPRGGVAAQGGVDQAAMILYLAAGVGVAALGEAARAARLRAKAMEEEAARRRAESQAVLAVVGDAVVVADAEGRVTSLNAAAEDLTGWPASEAQGKSLPAIFRIVDEQTRWEVENPALHALREGTVVRRANPAVLIAKGGGERPIDAAAAPVRDRSERAVGVVLACRDVSATRRAEAAMREGQERFIGLVEQAPFSVQVLSPDGRTLRVNRAWEELWGLDLGKIADYNVLQDPQLEAKGILPHIRRAFAGEPSVIPAIQYDPNETLPDRTIHADPRRWVSAVAYPLKDAAGAVREVVLVHEDVTDRKRDEEQIRASERRFRHLADAMPQMVWVTRPDRSVEYVNRRWLDYTGQTMEEALAPGGWAAAVHPQDVDRIVAASVRSHATGEPFEAEYRVKDASGAYRWHLGRAVAIFDEAGRLVRRFGAATDIDDRRRTERDAHFLAEASAALASIADEAGTLQEVARLAVPHFADWCSVDVAGEDGLPLRVGVAHVDPAKVELARELHRRHPPDPDAPRGVPRVVRTGEPEMVAEIADELLAAGARDEDHLRILRELGLRSYMCVPLKGRQGILGAITFVAAESGRRYGPGDLRLAEDLASRVAIAVENARLYAELKEADRRKDEFLATLAHELRNPLAPIRNALHLMGRSGDGRREPERAMAERNVVHLARLIDDLMDVARINRGRIELDKRVVDLSGIVRQAAETARPQIDERGLALTIAVPEAEVRVEADPTRLEQVFWNLLNNAAKYTEPGGEIRLSVEPEGGWAVARVRDTGVGITPDMLAKVFEMFFQGEDHKGRVQGGLGIGLGLVRTLVEMHGGSVAASSDGAASGSEFVVRLPMHAAAPAPTVEDEPPLREGGGGPPRRRVLVVDDNVDAARSLSWLLEKLYGQEVRIAHDGPGALAVAEEFRPEFVLLDIGMPGMDGYEVAGRLRGRPELRRTRIVALTGWGQEADLARTRAAGFDHHLVKPADPEVIVGLLARGEA
ncbi:PAS domain S-box protein [Paludisphaera soli]|uniref:PAS domain S-box protein n=1 Tax=Paludisphaera soli TaxID=2712865 RepID=UPI0013E9C0CA|nr:PAS domain S-box protein [Paludisphaera soli]